VITTLAPMASPLPAALRTRTATTVGGTTIYDLTQAAR